MGKSSYATVAPAAKSVPATRDNCTQSLPSYGYLLSKIHTRAASIAEWLWQRLTPATLKTMNLRTLDKFMSALVAAAGDEGTSPERFPARKALVRCASDALRETVKRVRRAGDGEQLISLHSARRMAATAKRNLEVVAGVDSSIAREVASFAAVLEKYVAAREEEEEAATMAEMEAASRSSCSQ